jgi:hypothetical protein
LCNRFLELLHFVKLKLCLLSTNSSILSPPVLANHLSNFCFYDFFTIWDTSSAWDHMEFVLCDWLILLNIIFLRFILVIAHDRVSFLRLHCNHLSVYLICFIHLSIGGCLSCSHLLAVVNNIVMNIDVQVSLWDPVWVLWDIYPQRIAGSC